MQQTKGLAAVLVVVLLLLFPLGTLPLHSNEQQEQVSH